MPMRFTLAPGSPCASTVSGIGNSKTAANKVDKDVVLKNKRRNKLATACRLIFLMRVPCKVKSK